MLIDSVRKDPKKADSSMLDQFVVFAFVWAYSLRAQYYNVGWLAAQNFIMGTARKEVRNSFNIYKIITEADSPVSLLSALSDRMNPIPDKWILAKKDNINEQDKDDIYQNYLHYFEANKFMEDKNEN